MTPNEFKAWFDGFCEVLPGSPNFEQWKILKKRIKEIDANPINYQPHYVQYYLPSQTHLPNWYPYRYSVNSSCATANYTNNCPNGIINNAYEMYSTGKQEAGAYK